MWSEYGGRRTLFAIAGTFFVSGFSALLYQVAWQRLLGFFSGSDVRSAAIVISAYLAGLGVGSLIGSFLSDRIDSCRAVRYFGFCNLGIAIFAFVSRFFFYDLLFKRLSTFAQFPMVALFIVFIGLLWPTTLMGLSLPLLSRVLVRNVDNAARLISLCYGVNTLGAVAGTLISGWYLIGTIGYEYTIYVGGGLSALVGIFNLVLAKRFNFRTRDNNLLPTTSSLDLRLVPMTVWAWCLLVFV